MIVRDRGDTWQVIRQPDHGDLAGQLAAAWGNDDFAAPDPRQSVVTAARRHDDGWAVWERSPALDPRSGLPCNFVDVPITTHLTFYRAGIAAIGDQDPYAALLVSMHCRGLYSGRYGTQPEFKMTYAEDATGLVEQFLAERDAAQPAMREQLGAGEDEVWTSYKLLQVYDRMALYFNRFDVENGHEDTIGPVPTVPGEDDVDIRIEPVAPWHVRMDPFPFGEAPARFTLVRRVLPKDSWASNEEFRRAFDAADAEQLHIVVDR